MHTLFLTGCFIMWGIAIAMFFTKNIKENTGKEIDFKIISMIFAGTLCYIVSCFIH